MNQETQFTADDQSSLAVCNSCANGKLHRTDVNSAIWYNDRLVVIEGIPALKCDKCHEQYFDDATAMILDFMRGDGFPSDAAVREMNVPVFSFRDRIPKNDISGNARETNDDT